MYYITHFSTDVLAILFFPALPKYLPIALETLRNGNPKKSEAGAGSELRKFSVLCLGFRKKLLGRVPFR